MVAGALALAGLVVLLLPYSTPLHSPSTVASLAPQGIQVPCKAPLVDALTSEPSGGWLDYAPGKATKVSSNGKRTGGEWCRPESIWRGTAGGLLIVLGIAGVTVTAIRRRRSSSDLDAVLKRAARVGAH